MWESLESLDQSLLVKINKSYLSHFDDFWLFVTSVEHWIPIYILFFLLFYRLAPLKKANLAALFIVATTAISLGLTNIVKNQVARIRPNNNLQLLEQLQVLQNPQNYSFWSGHSAVSMAVATFTVLSLSNIKKSKWWLLVFIWPLLFGSSRLFIGVHYPLDVITGYSVGGILGYICYAIYSRLLQLLHTA